MDLNELLHEHQVAVMKASASGNGDERDNHFAKVAEYAERIRQLRNVSQDATRPVRPDVPQTVIYGTYAGENAPPPAAPQGESDAVKNWEDEGGALTSPQVAMPDGVTTTVLRHYHVGPYVYQDLDLAVAEHLRQLSAARGEP